MRTKELLKFCLEKGLLLDKDLLNLFGELTDVETSKEIIEKIGKQTKQRVITKKIFSENREQVNQIFLGLPKENQNLVESLKIKLGLSIEISKEVSLPVKAEQEEQIIEDIKILSSPIIKAGKKIEVKDFVTHLRNRFSEMKKILQESTQLSNLVSIDKLYGNKQGISLIGIVLSKRLTKNGNLLF